MKFLTLALSALLTAPVHAGSTSPALPSAQEARATRPDIARFVDDLMPVRNRAGQFYIPGAWTATPEGQALLLERFASGRDSGELRVALAYSLEGSSFFEWSAIQSEPDPRVRAALLHLAKSEGGERGAELVVHALDDTSAWVRAEAARLAGYLPATPNVEAALLTGLQDAVPGVRGLSARSLGWHKVARAFEAIEPLLRDTEPEVVDHALKALAKIDPVRTLRLPELSELASSPYPRIAERAQRIQANGAP